MSIEGVHKLDSSDPSKGKGRASRIVASALAAGIVAGELPPAFATDGAVTGGHEQIVDRKAELKGVLDSMMQDKGILSATRMLSKGMPRQMALRFVKMRVEELLGDFASGEQYANAQVLFSILESGDSKAGSEGQVLELIKESVGQIAGSANPASDQMEAIRKSLGY